MKVSKLIILFLVVIPIFSTCTKDSDSVVDQINYDSFTDSRDGHVYKTVTIGSQIWMAENLAYLPKVDNPNTVKSENPYVENPEYYFVYDYYGNDVNEAKQTANYKKYGVLYSLLAAQKACPEGWHIPTDDEWEALINKAGGTSLASGHLKEIGTRNWNIPNEGATDTFGFTALPGGYCLDQPDDGYKFHDLGEAAAFRVGTTNWEFHKFSSTTIKTGYLRDEGCSVRCVKN